MALTLFFLVLSISVQVDFCSGVLPAQEIQVLNALVANKWIQAADCTVVSCVSDGVFDHVVSLDLSWRNLSGPFPSDFGNLTALQTLLLQGNRFSGAIPSQLFSLRRLQLINLSWNRFYGTLSTQFVLLTNLSLLDLSYNNQINGSIPSQFSRLSSLRQLLLGGNKLTGSIPAEFFTMRGLQSLDLSWNQLNEPLATEIGLMSSLTLLDLSFSGDMRGTIPTQLAKLSSLKQLLLAGNRITGTLPSELWLMNKLQSLDLAWNWLTASLPTQIGLLSSLSFLNLDFINYKSLAPSRFNESTGLIGTLPTELGLLSLLTSLQLSWNNVTGTIPSQLGRLTRLKRLSLRDNLLSGTIPSEFSKLALTAMLLNSNKLGGLVPNSLLPLLSNTKSCDVTSQTNSSFVCDPIAFIKMPCGLSCRLVSPSPAPAPISLEPPASPPPASPSPSPVLPPPASPSPTPRPPDSQPPASVPPVRVSGTASAYPPLFDFPPDSPNVPDAPELPVPPSANLSMSSPMPSSSVVPIDKSDVSVPDSPHLGIFIGASVGGLLLGILISVIVFFVVRRRKPPPLEMPMASLQCHEASPCSDRLESVYSVLPSLPQLNGTYSPLPASLGGSSSTPRAMHSEDDSEYSSRLSSGSAHYTSVSAVQSPSLHSPVTPESGSTSASNVSIPSNHHYVDMPASKHPQAPVM